jgi:hypothetical protein
MHTTPRHPAVPSPTGIAARRSAPPLAPSPVVATALEPVRHRVCECSWCGTGLSIHCIGPAEPRT